MSMQVSAVVAAVRRRLPDADATWLVTLVNQVHRQILADIPEPRRNVRTVSLTAGVQEYSLAEDAFQVDYAIYVTDATHGNNLMETNVEALGDEIPTWRIDPPNTPTQYYISSNETISAGTAVIGFVPAPALTTSGSYPAVKIYGSFLQAADLTGADYVLSTIQSSQVYIEGTSFLAAAEIRPQMAGIYKAEYEYQMQLAKKYVRTRLEGLQSYSRKNIRGGGYQAEVK